MKHPIPHRHLLVLAVALFGTLALACSEGTTTPEDVGNEFEIKDTDTTPEVEVIDQEIVEIETEVDTGCEPGETQCKDAKSLLVCVNGSFEEQLCFAGDVCNPAIGSCSAPLCPVPGLPFQCESESVERVCSSDQLSFDTRECNPGDTCVGGRCGLQICTPGARRCKTVTEIEECDETGSVWNVVETCTETTLCGSSGQCVELCELNAKVASFLGCEYYVVDMDNAGTSPGDTEIPTDDRPFAITVSNPHPQITAAVRITGAGATVTRNVPPGELDVIELDPYTDVDTGGLFNNATFYVVSSIPVTVHQFNPLNGDGVYSNDATLVLPINAYGKRYIAVGYPASQSVDPKVYVDVVAAEANTRVVVTSPIAIPPSGSFAALAANTPKEFTMQQGQLLHILGDGAVGTDLSGLTIESDKPVAVFSGTRCANIPNETSFCDHIEMQLFPVETWGTEYHAAKFMPRGTEDDVWRIIASEATTVSFAPPQNGQSTINLAARAVYEFRSKQDFIIKSQGAPILVAQFMVGSEYPGVPADVEVPAIIMESPCDAFSCSLEAQLYGFSGKCIPDGCVLSCTSTSQCQGAASDLSCKTAGGYCVAWTGIGDPAFTLAVPAEQYRTDYIVMTPPGYSEDYITVVAPTGVVPMMDSARLDEAPWNGTPASLNGEMDVYRIQVDEGVHVIQANAGFGVQAYGYNQNVSYAFPAGLNLVTIN